MVMGSFSGQICKNKIKCSFCFGCDLLHAGAPPRAAFRQSGLRRLGEDSEQLYLLVIFKAKTIPHIILKMDRLSNQRESS